VLTTCSSSVALAENYDPLYHSLGRCDNVKILLPKQNAFVETETISGREQNNKSTKSTVKMLLHKIIKK